MRTDERVVMITGANGGIGSAVARRFGMGGSRLILNYYCEGDVVEDLVREFGVEKTLMFEADVSKPERVSKMMECALERFGRVDVLVNNAGITRDRTFLKMTPAQWHEVVDVNLHGVYNVTKAVIGQMTERGVGAIVNISSIVAATGNFGQTNYSASKAALIGFTKSLAQEVAGKGVRVNAIAPGFVDTEMTRHMPIAVRERVIQRIPMSRFGMPDEIADAVYYLAGASYVTGTVLHINGGML